MRSKTDHHSEEAEKAVRDIRRATRRQFAAEEKVRIVIAGLRGEDSIAECAARRAQPEPLSLVEGLSGGGQEAAGRRHRTRSDQ